MTRRGKFGDVIAWPKYTTHYQKYSYYQIYYNYIVLIFQQIKNILNYRNSFTNILDLQRIPLTCSVTQNCFALMNLTFGYTFDQYYFWLVPNNLVIKIFRPTLRILIQGTTFSQTLANENGDTHVFPQTDSRSRYFAQSRCVCIF